MRSKVVWERGVWWLTHRAEHFPSALADFTRAPDSVWRVDLDKPNAVAVCACDHALVKAGHTLVSRLGRSAHGKAIGERPRRSLTGVAPGSETLAVIACSNWLVRGQHKCNCHVGQPGKRGRISGRGKWCYPIARVTPRQITITWLGTSHTKTHDTVSTVYGDQIDLTKHRLTVVLTAMYEVTRLRRRCSRGRKGAAVGVMYVCMAGGATGFAKGARERERGRRFAQIERKSAKTTDEHAHASVAHTKSVEISTENVPPATEHCSLDSVAEHLRGRDPIQYPHRDQ